NQSEMDQVEHLRRKLQKLEKKNLELNNQHNQQISLCEKELMKLRFELERGEVLREGLERKMSFARKMAHIQMYPAEDELCDVK
ncbi:CC171 protein, partial [Prunella fulvescens]|nr:CC171 protein [Prunella fulvescens]NXT15193.1 CC171 protein [Prunella fulvescens]